MVDISFNVSRNKNVNFQFCPFYERNLDFEPLSHKKTPSSQIEILLGHSKSVAQKTPILIFFSYVAI